ncbi:MAG: glycosyltransferase family 39 protein [Acidobacteriota bacterium]
MTRLGVRVALGALLFWGLVLRVWFATPGLDSTRFWDERYPLENVRPIVQEGSFRPANGLHPAFTHLPHALVLRACQLVHDRTGSPAFEMLDERGEFTATAYLICRLIHTLFGVASLFLVFLIGRRMGGDRLGLLAAFLLAVVPYHIQASVKFMADGMLIFSLCLAFYLSLRAVDRSSLGSYLVVGAAIGLALSSKFNAGPIAIPLVVGTFLSDDRSWRTFCYLVLAGAASVVVFLSINPYVVIDFEIYRSSFGRTLRIYERHGKSTGVDSPLDLVSYSIRALLSPLIHGRVVGILAIAGALGVGASSIRDARRSQHACYWLMLLSYLVAYPTLYALSTSNPDSHNWLPMSPFLALTASWMVVTIWDRLRAVLPFEMARPVAVGCLLLLVGSLAWSATSFTYKTVIPRTGDQALAVLSRELRRPPPGRVVVSEHPFAFWDRQTRHLRRHLAVSIEDDLSSLPKTRLKFADAEVFPASRLKARQSGVFYRQRLESSPARQVFRLDPKLFKSWGPSLVAIVHPMRSIGRPVEGFWERTEDDRRVFVARISDRVGRNEIVSLEFGLPGRRTGVLEVAGERQMSTITFRAPHHNLFQTTPRFRLSKPLELQLGKPVAATRLPFELRRWRRVKSAAGRAKNRDRE